jgi:pyridoxamine 5'-phosphate oxidase
MNNLDIAQIRKEYALQSLDITDVVASPFLQFKQWLEQAIEAQALEPTAMHLATVGEDNRPSGRIVLLKGVENEQFVFYTNYQSRKGTQLFAQPFASLTFFWAELERQVRIEGKVVKVSEETSTAYFQSRPRESQLGAWTSPQSQPIENRAFLEQKFLEVQQQYANLPTIPKPAHWGGYALVPDYMEFWQGRQSRLHDRVAYSLRAGKEWEITRLAP